MVDLKQRLIVLIYLVLCCTGKKYAKFKRLFKSEDEIIASLNRYTLI